MISSPTRSRYSSYICSRSASRMRWRITCLAVWAAMRPKSCGVTSRVSIWSANSASRAGSISGASGTTISPVSGSTRRPSSSAACSSASSRSWSSRSAGSSSSSTRKSPDVAVHRHARVLRRAGLLLVGGEQCVLEGEHELLLGDPLLSPQCADCIDDLLRHALVPQQVGSVDVGVGDGDHAAVGGDGHLLLGGAEQLTRERLGARRASPRVRTRARWPTKRRKCSGLVSGRRVPGEETSSA